MGCREASQTDIACQLCFQISYIDILFLKHQVFTEGQGKNPERITEELERLNILFQKGRVSYEYYEKEYARLEKELSNASIIEFQPSRMNPETLRKILNGDFKQAYETLSPENRQAYWRGIIKEIVLTEDHQIDHIIFL